MSDTNVGRKFLNSQKCWCKRLPEKNNIHFVDKYNLIYYEMPAFGWDLGLCWGRDQVKRVLKHVHRKLSDISFVILTKLNLLMQFSTWDALLCLTLSFCVWMIEEQTHDASRNLSRWETTLTFHYPNFRLSSFPLSNRWWRQHSTNIPKRINIYIRMTYQPVKKRQVISL